jgi:hypothetical protein
VSLISALVFSFILPSTPTFIEGDVGFITPKWNSNKIPIKVAVLEKQSDTLHKVVEKAVSWWNSRVRIKLFVLVKPSKYQDVTFITVPMEKLKYRFAVSMSKRTGVVDSMLIGIPMEILDVTGPLLLLLTLRDLGVVLGLAPSENKNSVMYKEVPHTKCEVPQEDVNYLRYTYGT